MAQQRLNYCMHIFIAIKKLMKLTETGVAEGQPPDQYNYWINSNRLL